MDREIEKVKAEYEEKMKKRKEKDKKKKVEDKEKKAKAKDDEEEQQAEKEKAEKVLLQRYSVARLPSLTSLVRSTPSLVRTLHLKKRKHLVYMLCKSRQSLT